jgi:hypothetical protein
MTGKLDLGITINVFEPNITMTAGVLTAYEPRGRFVGSISNVVESYSHTSEVFGGYISAQFSMKAEEGEIDDWLERGMNRHIEVYNPYGVQIWEGFVNQITYSVGGFSVVRGPLLDLANRVWVTYASISTLVVPATQGLTVETPLVSNTASIEKYGLLERIVDGGTRDEINYGEATRLRDTYLAEQRVLTNKTWNPTGSSEPTLTVDCCGYMKRLERIYYINTVAGSWTCTQAVSGILDADLLLNHLFSSANASIGANAIAIAEQREYTPCDTILRDIVSFGGVAYVRWLFYVGNNRYATFRAVDNTIAYIQPLRDPSQAIRTAMGDVVHPSDVQPGKWMFFPDFAIGRKFDNVLADLSTDPRALFIEAVTFTAPDQLDISGGKTDRLSALLKQYELGAI